MSKNISYNNWNFQDSNFVTKDIIYRNVPSKTIDLEQKVRSDGFHVINTYYNSKEITIDGVVTRDTEDNLRTSINSMKEALYVDEANLDIDDGSSTMRYVCSLKSLDIPEEFYHITHLPYRIVFLCQPFGKATTTSSQLEIITSDTSSIGTINPIGSAPPRPKLRWTCSGSPTSAITQIKFTNSSTNKSITVGSLAIDANGDYLEVDCDAMTVQVSHDGGAAVNIDFDGVFPIFLTNTNSYSTIITGGGASWSLRQYIEYYAQYL